MKNAAKIVFCIFIILILSNSVLAYNAITKASIPKTYVKIEKSNEKSVSSLSINSKIKDAVLTKPEEENDNSRTKQVDSALSNTIIGRAIDVINVNEDLLDDPPEIIDINVNPSTPMQGQQFTIRVEAEDDNAMQKIALWLGSDYEEQPCTGTTCTIVFTKTQNTMGHHQYMIRAVDSKDQGHTLMQDVEVLEQNQPPVLVAIGDRSVDEMQLLTIDVDANDPDIGDTLTYSTDAAFGNMDSNTGVFTWIPDALSAGTYPVRFTVSDGQFEDYEDITITVNNVPQAPPTISSVSVTPTTAYTDDVLTCVASGWSSSVGASPAYYYDWQVEGISTGITVNTFDCSTPGCDKHDNVECFVTPYDTEGTGTALSDSVVIQNSLPTVSPAITPNPAYTLDDLTCDCSSYTDADGDTVTCTGYDWFEDSALVYEDDPNFYALGTDRGNQYYCTAIPNDGEDDGNMGTSAVVIIQNTPSVFDWVSFQISNGLDVLGLVWVNLEDVFTAGLSDDDGDVPTLTCSGESAYQVSNCAYNFTALSGPRDPSCQNNPNTGCYNMPDNHGEYTVTLSADDGYDVSTQDVRFNVSQRYLPPEVSVSNVTMTEGDSTFCPCSPIDPDGGSASATCAGPINGAGPWLATYDDIGVYNTYCTATDDEGQQTIKDFTITVNPAYFNISIRTRIDDDATINIREEYDYLHTMYGNPQEDAIARGLLNDKQLTPYVTSGWATAVTCWDTLCVNTLELNTMQDYFNNFQSNLTAQEQIDIHGSNWAQLMDNGGVGDSNEEIGLIRIWVQQI